MISFKDLICAILVFVLAVHAAPIPENLKTDDELNGTNTKSSACVGVVAVCPQVSLNLPSPKKCFSADNWVYLSNGQRKNIGQLRRGDTILASEGSTLVASEMILMLDSDPYTEAIFYTLETESNQTISLTAQHLIPIVSDKGMPQYVSAENVKPGDVLYVLSEIGLLIRSPVVQVRTEIKLGYFAPMTMSGTLLVNNVLASCFSDVYSHERAQASMAILRWYHTLANFLSLVEPFGPEEHRGMHWIPQVMLNVVQRVFPSVLHLPSKDEYDICHALSPGVTESACFCAN